MAKEETRNENGQFTKGNTIGEETRFGEGNNASKKYDERFCEEIVTFFLDMKDVNPEIVYEERYKDGELVSKIPKMVLPPKFPTFELFAAKIGVTHKTLRNWCEMYPRFSEAYDIAKNIQLGISKVGGMLKYYDSNFSKFLLSNDHGMSDKSVTDTTITFNVDYGSSEIDEESN